MKKVRAKLMKDKAAGKKPKKKKDNLKITKKWLAKRNLNKMMKKEKTRIKKKEKEKFFKKL
jgi:hypothetical protein